MFDRALETLQPDRLREHQWRRFRAMARELFATNPFVARKWREAGVASADDLRDWLDFRRLPLTSKSELVADQAAHPPFGTNLTYPLERYVRVHQTSGTSGAPLRWLDTQEAWEWWARCWGFVLRGAGVGPADRVFFPFSFGLFIGFWAGFEGARALGALAIPGGGQDSPTRLAWMQALGATVLVCTPSYALHIGEVARAEGFEPGSLPLRYGHFGGEPWTEEKRVQIERGLGILAFNNYGLSEVIGPGVAGECGARAGMHVQEDHFVVECVDPDTLEPVPDGVTGELVFTTLTKEALPVLRYRTRDLASLDRSPCPCGRTGVRMSRLVGRSDDMLIIRGVNVFPSQIEEALLRVEGTAPHYLIEVSRPGSLDEAIVKVEMRPADFRDEMRQLVELRDRIDREIHAVTGIRMKVELVAPNTLERSAGKARRVLDHRKG